MRRIIGLLVLAALFVVPSLAFAESQPVGFYIAPKFIASSTWIEKFGVNGARYAGGGTYVPIDNEKSDTTFGGALAIGYDFGKRTKVPVRFELEYAMFSEIVGDAPSNLHWLIGGDPMDFDIKQKMDVRTAFVNIYYDVHSGDPDVPFSFWVGGGLGTAFIDSKSDFYIRIPAVNYTESWSTAGSKKTTNFAWNVGIGVGYDFTSNLTLDVGYRFASLGKADTNAGRGSLFYVLWGLDQSTEAKQIYMHQFMLGLRLGF